MQNPNAPSPIVVIFDFSSNEIISNFEHLANAYSPIELIDEGIEIDFNSSQYLNVDSSIVVKFDSSSNEIFVKFEHL